MFVIGSGIIGLCVAEYFSRKNKNITIISDENPMAGSLAAAANLATKGQLFGRDLHFQAKLDAKKIYYDWLKNLILENNEPNKFLIQDIFKQGVGIDVFKNEEDRNSQLKRVLQNKEELLYKNLPLNFIEAHNSSSHGLTSSSHGLTSSSHGLTVGTILYKNEAWVDASLLLNLLRSILNKRGVKFLQSKLSNNLFDEIVSKQNTVIFCTGAWTKQLLTQIGLPLSNGFYKAERLTVGPTFYTKINAQNIIQDYALFEILSDGKKLKATFSGNKSNLYISSTSIKIDPVIATKVCLQDDNILLQNEFKFEAKNKEFLEFVQTNFSNLDNLEEKKGFRVGYGHSEILIESLELNNPNLKAIVCCGAHKSGFLFGPVVGEKIEKLLQS